MSTPVLLAMFAVIALSACSSTRPPESPEVSAVQLSSSPAPPGYVKVGQVDVVDGRGCGVMGEPGSPQGAQARMRSEAARLGAAYVQVTRAEQPPINHQCREHAHKLSGIAYRKPSAPVPSATPASPPPATASASNTLQDYEGSAPASKAAPATGRSQLTVGLTPGDGSANSLSVGFTCSGDDQRADLDVWSAPLTSDWSRAGALTLRIKPDAPLSLRVSFMDGNHAGYTQQTEPLVAGQWQTVTLPFEKFLFNPFGPPGDVPGAPQDRRNVSAFGFAPNGCSNGHFLIDDFALAQ